MHYETMLYSLGRGLIHSKNNTFSAYDQRVIALASPTQSRRRMRCGYNAAMTGACVLKNAINLKQDVGKQLAGFADFIKGEICCCLFKINLTNCVIL